MWWPGRHFGAIALSSWLISGTMLPNYMVPAQIVRLDRTSDDLRWKDRSPRRCLRPTSRCSGQRIRSPSFGGRTVTGGYLEGCARDPNVGVTDNYLELGGDSITAIQIASRLRRAGWALEPGDIIRRPTIASLAPACGVCRKSTIAGPRQRSGSLLHRFSAGFSTSTPAICTISTSRCS